MFMIILTPWQVLPSGYIYLFFVVTLLVGLAVVFSNFKSFSLLILLIFYSFFLHFYLPLSHPLIYGADGWRHIASEAQLLHGHWPVHPTLADGTRGSGLEIGNWKLEIGDVAYGVFWVVTALIAKITGLSLIVITRWFQPILFSIAFPLLLWKLTEYLGLSTRVRLFTIWFSNLPFALQAAGTFSLPVNFGFLFFLGGLVILAARSNGEKWASRKILLAYAALLAVNYLLFLILYLIAWGTLEVQKSRNQAPASAQSRSRGEINKSISQKLWLLIIPVAIIIPTIELLAGYSHFAPVAIFSSLKQFVGNLLGWYVATGPRPHDIATGNILFNQPPAAAFVPNWFTAWRWWLPVYALILWGEIVVMSIIFARRATPPLQRRGQGEVWLAILFLGLLLGYFISRYILSGDQILSRRLDGTLALLFCLIYGMYKEWLGQKYNFNGAKFWVPVLIFCSVGITASYSLGPDARAVSVDEYHAMQYVWNQEKDQSQHCVIADTYPLLALEAISGGKIVGGGFPIDVNFGQSERVALFEKYSRELVIKNNTAVQLPVPGHETCWFYK